MDLIFVSKTGKTDRHRQLVISTTYHWHWCR